MDRFRVSAPILAIVFLLPMPAAAADLPAGALARFELKGYKFAQQGVPVAIAPDAKSLATGSPEETATLWGLAKLEAIQHFKGDDGSIEAIALSPDGKLLATAGDEGQVFLWDLTTNKLQNRLKQRGTIR